MRRTLHVGNWAGALALAASLGSCGLVGRLSGGSVDDYSISTRLVHLRMPITPGFRLSQGSTLAAIEDDELLFDVYLERVGDPLDAELLVRKHDGQLYVSAKELFRALEFAITVDEHHFAGWFASEGNQFDVDLGKKVVRSRGRSMSLHDGDIWIDNHEPFVKLQAVGDWFGLELVGNIPRMALEIRSDFPLPAEMRALRHSRFSRAGHGSQAESLPVTTIDTDQAVASWPIADLELDAGARNSGTQISNSRDAFYSYNITVASDFAYHTLLAFVSGDERRPIQQLRATLSRTDETGNLLGPIGATSYELGDVYAPATSLTSRSRSGVGITVTSFPLSEVSTETNTTVEGTAEPNFDLELYINDNLFQVTQVDASGRYSVENVPLSVGQNEIVLVFSGPQGQRRVEARYIAVQPQRVKPGKFGFQVALMKSDETLGSLLALTQKFASERGMSALIEGEYGIADNWSLVGSFASEPLVTLERSDVASVGIRGQVGPFLFSGDVGVSDDGGVAFRLLTQSGMRGLNVTLEHVELRGFTSSEFDSAQGLMRQTDLTLAFGVRSSWLPPGNLRLSSEFQQFKSGRTRIDTQATYTASLPNISFSNTVDYIFSEFGGRSSQQVSGRFLSSTLLWQTSVLATLGYDFSRGFQLTSAIVTAQRPIGEHWIVQGTLDHEFSTPATSEFEGSATLKLDSALLSFNGSFSDRGDYTFGIGLRFSSFVDPLSGSLRLRRDPLARTGGIEPFAFLDDDGNGHWDAAKTIMDETNFSTGGMPSIADRSVANVGHISEISLDQSSLADPYLAAATDVRVVTRPGVISLVPIPVVKTIDIEGKIDVVSSQHAAEHIAGISVKLVSAKGTEWTVLTDENGLYFFDKVPRSKYTIVVPAQATRLGQFDDVKFVVVAESKRSDIVDVKSIQLRLH